MNLLLQKIQTYFLTKTSWIFLTAIFMVSNLLLHQGFESTWSNYFWFFGKIVLVFSPVLTFILFRNWLKRTLSIYLFIGLWIYCFLFHAIVISYIEIEIIPAKNALGEVILRLTSFLFFFIEISIQVSEYWKAKNGLKLWVTGFSLEKGIWSSMAIFSVAYISLGYFLGAELEVSAINFLSYCLQVFLILIPYYCFYLINHYFLVTKLLKERGILFYVFGFLATIIFFYPIAAQMIYLLPMVRETQIHPLNDGDIFGEVNWLIPSVGMLLSIPFIFIFRYFKQNKELAELEQEKSATELNFLKNQINPHFFFNTLNNLYALSLTKDQRTPEVILQLSELMRYVIYKGKEETVFLREEIKYIDDYLDLQRIRLHKNLDLKFEKDIDDEHLKIPPLLVISLIENAFKHGIEPAENACFLHLFLKTENGNLTFICKNSFEEKLEQENGIGLKNLKRRLALRFPNRHEFEILESENVFKVILNINNL